MRSLTLTANTIANSRPPQILSIGFPDALLGGGLRRSSLTGVFGRAGVGKSSFAFGAASHVAASGYPVVYAVSPRESSVDQIIHMARRMSNSGSEPVGSGVHLAETESVDDAISVAKELGAPLLVVDSLGAHTRFSSHAASSALDAMQRFARDNDCAVLFLGAVRAMGFRAGGMAAVYQPDTVLDLLAGHNAAEPSDRILRLEKNRWSPIGEMALRMTASGLVAPRGDVEDGVSRLLHHDAS
ncbi:MAG: hypothetical protein WBG53_01650 [Rhodococcus sp. (in: high G+C Gram-positive bacteria)]